jgi:hypothetical protein
MNETQQLLRDLSIQPFWDHLATGSEWKTRITEHLNLPDTDQEAANKVIAEQEIRIRRMEEYIHKMHNANRQARDHLDNALNSLGSLQGYTW